MIICSRCGKENQKHYKFCLGCGAKLEAPAAPAEAARPAAVPAGGGLAETAAIPIIKSGAVSPVSGAQPSFGALSPAATAAVPTSSTGSSSGSSTGSSTGSSKGSSTGTTGRLSGSLPSSPAPAPVSGPIGLDGTVPGSSVAAGDMVPCSKCGKPVVATYAFCGSCGQRMKPGGGGAAAPAAARTMHMGMAAPAVRAAPRGHLTLIRPDGTEGGVHPMMDGENLIGRGQGSLFDADPYLSPRHAEFTFTEGGLVVRDLRSLNGVFIKIMQEERLETGDVFRIGQELLRFDVIAPPAPLEDGTEVIGTPNPGFWGRLSVIVGRDVDGPAFPLFDETVVLGRERGDILFPEDGYVSGTHAQLTLRDGHVFLSDLGSSNGTFFRIRGSRTITSGSLMLMGQQLFRASYR